MNTLYLQTRSNESEFFIHTHSTIKLIEPAGCVVVVAEAGSILVSPDGVVARWMATAIIGAHTATDRGTPSNTGIHIHNAIQSIQNIIWMLLLGKIENFDMLAILKDMEQCDKR